MWPHLQSFCAGDFAPPEPEFRPEFRETNFGCPNFGPEFLGRKEAPRKIHPREIHLPKFTFQNSTQKSGQKFTLHLCSQEASQNFQRFSRYFRAVSHYLQGARHNVRDLVTILTSKGLKLVSGTSKEVLIRGSAERIWGEFGILVW